ncbi:MAG: multidrug effflux MFS transporter [Hyphomicrobiales bacterium]|nr:multidrug effflux MFS transporter [Hyphomicrobiales bacterium]
MLRPDTVAFTALLGLLTAFGPVATDLYVPSMPDIARQLGVSTSDVQLTLSSYLVGFAVGQTFYGPISDRYGRKPVLSVALGLFCLATFACAIAPTVEALIAARALQALGGAGAIVLSRAIVRDLYVAERAGRELSRMGAIMSIAPVAAPLVGGLVQVSFGWRANFVIILAVGMIATFIVWRALPETLRHHSPTRPSAREIPRAYRAIAGNRGFLAHLAIVACSYAGLFAWISGSPFVLQDLYGLSALEFGIAFAASCLGSLASAAIAGAMVMRVGLDLTIGIGALMLAGGGLTMVAALVLGLDPVASMVLSMILYHAGLMLAMPQAIAGAMTPFPERAGTASSLLGVVQQLSAALIGIVVGHVIGRTATPLASIIALMGCLATVLWACSRGTRRESLAVHAPGHSLASRG